MLNIRCFTLTPRYCLAIITALTAILLTISGCITFVEESDKPYDPYKGQISLFLNGPEKTSRDITFELLAVNILAEDGKYKEIMRIPRSINSLNIRGTQVPLGETTLPEGKYEKLQFILKEASFKRKGRASTLALPPEGIEVDININLQRHRNISLFIDWNADASIVNEYQFNPVFSVKRQGPELRSLLIYVTNEGSDNVSVINRQSGEIVATIMVGKEPRGIAAGINKDRLKIYVANYGSNTISVIDPTNNKVETEIPIRLGWGPESIAVVSLSSESDEEFLFVANYRSNTVSLVDTASFEEVERINVGSGPIAVAADPPADNLFDSNFLSPEDVDILMNYREKFHNVYVANKNSNDVSVLRMNIITNRVEEVINVKAEWSPIALDVDYQKGKVYVANYNSDKLSVIDILQIIKGNTAGAVTSINDLGDSTIGVISDPVFDRIYLLKERSREILVIKPSTDSYSPQKPVITPIMGRIAVGSSPRSIILDPEIMKIYVVNSGSNNISVIDKITGKEEQIIPVSKKPYGAVMFQD